MTRYCVANVARYVRMLTCVLLDTPVLSKFMLLDQQQLPPQHDVCIDYMVHRQGCALASP